MTGYAHPCYAQSLREFGTPRHLPRSKGWILERDIPGTRYRDGMGCYPLFSCEDWSRLPEDLDELSGEIVGLAVVPVPFGSYDIQLLQRCFDRVVHFKDHFVADLRQPPQMIVKRSHQATARRALRKVRVRSCPRPEQYLAKWLDLFSVLVQRHAISGIRRFSKDSFARQLSVPGLTMFEAKADETTVGLDLWYVQDGVAYGHLAAFSELGYKLRASYATKWHALEHFGAQVRWIDFGAGAGLSDGSGDGLTAFKRGWANCTQPVYLCQRIFQPETYDRLCVLSGKTSSTYFPAYRDGEFA